MLSYSDFTLFEKELIREEKPRASELILKIIPTKCSTCEGDMSIIIFKICYSMGPRFVWLVL